MYAGDEVQESNAPPPPDSGVEEVRRWLRDLEIEYDEDKFVKKDDNKKTIAKKGGIKVIINAMKEFAKENGGVQREGCGALKNLAPENDDNQKSIAKEGGIKVIINAMKDFAKDLNVQREGCGALRNLALNDDNQKTIAKEGGIKVILDTMKRHQENSDVQQYGCSDSEYNNY